MLTRAPVDVRIELQRCSGSQFDPVVVSAFIRVLDMQESLNAAALPERSSSSDPELARTA